MSHFERLIYLFSIVILLTSNLMAAEPLELEDREKLSLIHKTNEIGITSRDMSERINKNTTVGIHMGHVGYTNPQSKYQILSSHGAATCVILGVYNRQTKNAAMAHLTCKTDLKEIQEVFKNIRDSDKFLLEAHLVGGDLTFSPSYTINHIYNIILAVKNTKNVEIKTSKLGDDVILGDQLALDSTTGEVTYDFDFFKTFIKPIDDDRLLFQSILNQEKIDN